MKNERSLTPPHRDVNAPERRGPSIGRRRLLAAGVPAAAAAAVVGLRAPAAGAAETTDGLPTATLADLRAMTEPPEATYVVVDPGKEGLFHFDPDDTASADNTGTVVVSAAGARFKRAIDGPISAAWFGAVGDAVTDDAPAIQAAIDAAQSLPPSTGNIARAVHIPAGRHRIGAPIVIKPTPPLHIFGDGIYATILNGASTDLEAIFAFADTATNNYFRFESMQLIRGQYGIHSERIAKSTFRDLYMIDFAEAALALGYGWCLTVQDCVLYRNRDGFRGLVGALNGLNIVNSVLYKNTGTAITLTAGGYGVRISGCTFERNDVTPILIYNNIQHLDISDNYFEHSSDTGYHFANPDRLVRAHIVINGGPDATVVESDYSAGPVRVSDNFVDMSNSISPTYVVACYGAFGGLEVQNNAVNDSSSNRRHTLVLSGTSKTGKGARMDNLCVRRNGVSGAASKRGVELHPLHVDDLAGGATQLHEASIEGVYAVNYSAVLARFRPVSRSASGTWRKSPRAYRRHEVWELSGATASGWWGFDVDLDDCPELAGKYVYFACAVTCSDDSAAALSTSQLGPQDPVAGAGWQVLSYVDVMPESGVVTFSVAKVSGAASSPVAVAHPVLSEVGVRYDTHRDAAG